MLSQGRVGATPLDRRSGGNTLLSEGPAGGPLAARLSGPISPTNQLTCHVFLATRDSGFTVALAMFYCITGPHRVPVGRSKVPEDL